MLISSVPPPDLGRGPLRKNIMVSGSTPLQRSTVASQVAAMRAKTVVMASNFNNSSHSKVGKVSRSMERREAFLEG